MAKQKKNQGEQPPEITTVEQLAEIYPDLVKEIVREAASKTVKDIAAMEPEKFKEAFPKLHKNILANIPDSANLKVEGFLLDHEDPFAAGVLREYSKITGKTNLRLPFVLPKKDTATKAALANYVLRANGSDNARAIKAQKYADSLK